MAPRPSTRPCSSTVASTEPTSSGSTGMRVVLMVPLWWGDVSPWVATAKVKRLEQDRDAGPSHRQGGPPSLLTWPSGYWARRGWAAGGYPVRPPAQEVLSLYAFAVKSRYPHTRTSRTSPYEFVRVHNWAQNCTHFRPARPSSTAKALLRGAPGRVRTCDPPLRRCRHRVRTSSSVSSQTPRPGLSPRRNR